MSSYHGAADLRCEQIQRAIHWGHITMHRDLWRPAPEDQWAHGGTEPGRELPGLQATHSRHNGLGAGTCLRARAPALSMQLTAIASCPCHGALSGVPLMGLIFAPRMQQNVFKICNLLARVASKKMEITSRLLNKDKHRAPSIEICRVPLGR